MKNNDSITSSIIMTLCYADVFDYPLTKSELYKFAIGTKSIPKHLFNMKLNKLFGKLIKQKYSFFHLMGRDSIVLKRKRRYLISEKKIIKARKISKILSKIPTILLIGISGSLSLKNAKKQDDIDLFFITYPNTLWITRLFVVLLLLLLREKRARRDIHGTDKICPNMFLSSNSLEIEKKNLFTAHEITQLRLIFNKKNTYEQFLYKNRWIRTFLPHTMPSKYLLSKNYEYKNFSSVRRSLNKVAVFLLDKFDHILYKLQHYYMLPHKYKEIVKRDVAYFHTFDKTSDILYSFRKRYTQILFENIREIKQLNKSSSLDDMLKIP